MASDASHPLVSVIMGSKSDWETMSHAVDMLKRFDVPHEQQVVSAHRTPLWLAEFARDAEGRGIEVVIAGAGGAAHLPGMAAAQTVLPVLGVPVQSHALNGLDSLLSIVQMPAGVPVGTLAIGKAGAINAGLLAVAILSNSRPELARAAAEVSRRADRRRHARPSARPDPTGRGHRTHMTTLLLVVALLAAQHKTPEAARPPVTPPRREARRSSGGAAGGAAAAGGMGRGIRRVPLHP